MIGLSLASVGIFDRVGDVSPRWYSRFTISSPNCILNTAIAHIIKVLEQWSLTHDYAIRIHVGIHHSNTEIMHVSDCSVQRPIGTRNHEMTV